MKIFNPQFPVFFKVGLVILSIVFSFSCPQMNAQVPIYPVNQYVEDDSVLYVIAYSGLNLRDAPSREGAIIGNLPTGAKVEVLGHEYVEQEERPADLWYRVQYKAQQGYASGRYLFPMAVPVTEEKNWVFSRYEIFGGGIAKGFRWNPEGHYYSLFRTDMGWNLLPARLRFIADDEPGPTRSICPINKKFPQPDFLFGSPRHLDGGIVWMTEPGVHSKPREADSSKAADRPAPKMDSSFQPPYTDSPILLSPSDVRNKAGIPISFSAPLDRDLEKLIPLFAGEVAPFVCRTAFYDYYLYNVSKLPVVEMDLGFGYSLTGWTEFNPAPLKLEDNHTYTDSLSNRVVLKGPAGNMQHLLGPRSLQKHIDFGAVRLVFFGDLDQDGKMDLILDCGDYQAGAFVIWLSSLAGPDELVGIAGLCQYRAFSFRN